MSKYRAFSDLFYASYSGLQMMAFAFSKEKKKYSYSCYAFRQTVIKKYKDGAMHVGDMYKERIRQFMDAHDKCWYCGCPITECGALTADHVFPRAKGGEMIADNLIMVCKHCNSSKDFAGTDHRGRSFGTRGQTFCAKSARRISMSMEAVFAFVVP